MTTLATEPRRLAAATVVATMAVSAVLLHHSSIADAVPSQAAGTAAPPLSCGSDPVTRFLEARASDDALDFVAQNRLAIACIERARETGDLALIARASAVAGASLEAAPAEVNP